MNKRKLPVGLVVAFAVLATTGIFVNGGQSLRSVGFNAGGGQKPDMQSRPLSAEELAEQRRGIGQARSAGKRPAASLNSEKPALLMTRDASNVRQAYNPAQTPRLWWVDHSYTKKIADESEALRAPRR